MALSKSGLISGTVYKWSYQWVCLKVVLISGDVQKWSYEWDCLKVVLSVGLSKSGFISGTV